MIESESAPRRSMRKRMIFIIMPKTLWARLTVLGLLFTVIARIFPIIAIGLPLIIIGAYLLVAGFIAAVWSSLRQRDKRIVRLFRTLAATVGIIIAYFAVFELSDLLAFMAAGGSGNLYLGIFAASSISSAELGGVEEFVVLVTIMLLVWIPQVFFRIQLDMRGAGNSQHVLLTLITWVSCVLTGVFVILLHFGDGPLSSVKVGTLVVGVIGAVLLVAPPYKALARVCWQRGIIGVFSFQVLKQHWSNIVTEFGKALDRAERETALSSPKPDR